MTDNWENNAIQFPRLIVEAEAAGAFTNRRVEDMATSMDLSGEEIGDLIERARDEWDEIVARTPEGPFPHTSWPARSKDDRAGVMVVDGSGVSCEDCGGTGHDVENDDFCQTCGGRGTVQNDDPEGDT